MSPAPDPLFETMERVGVSLSPAEFVAAVAETFRIAEPVPEETVQARFRATRGYRDFRVILRRVGLATNARILAVGCGKGLAGRSATYAAEVTREIHPAAIIDETNYTAGMQSPTADPYDLVVTHSLLHFVLDVGPLCEFIRASVAPGGWYVMANEPNARFWRNDDCMRERERVNTADAKRRRLLKYTEPSRYISRLLRAVGLAGSHDASSGINRLLRERLGMRGELTAKEIVRIVDPHLPDEMPGQYRLGGDGLDWEELEAGPLAGLKVESMCSSGYVMRDNPARVPARWRELDRELGRRYPMDGSTFTALWQKDEGR